jgi:signal transduction histidine kinase
MPASTRPAQRRSRFGLPSLANARIRSKLGLILIVPIAAILTLAALRLVDATNRATDASQVGELTALSSSVSSLAYEVHHERMIGAQVLDPAGLSKDVSDALPKTWIAQTKATDTAVKGYRDSRAKLSSVPDTVKPQLDQIDAQLDTLDKLRKSVTDKAAKTSVDQLFTRYGVIIDDLVSYRETLSTATTDSALSDELRAAAAFSRAKQGVDNAQAAAFLMIGADNAVDLQRVSSYLSTLTAQQEAFVAFNLSANNDQQSVVSQAISGDAVSLSDAVNSTLQNATADTRTSRTNASSALGAVDNLMRWAEQQLDSRLVRDVNAVTDSVQRQAVIESAIVLVVLIIVIALALAMARSMIGSLRRLRQSAIAVAEFDLPETVSKFRDAQSVGQDTPDRLAAQVRDPIELDTKDEIGEVARAFNMVHREAVRVAAEQALLRTSVSAMFLGLARRSQTLVDRMIGQLDRIERTEEDPKRLAELFQLDHLATRMRRNDENVLVLADADSTPPRREDAPLIDVMRAAQSEIEMYQRVEFGTLDEDVLIASHAVNDVVRLLAELLDNATRFSPPTGVVVLEARRLGDRALIQIEDGGLGMSPETLSDYNARLAAPPALDVATFRMMGLAVVGRLAHRHGITVQLRDRSGSGTIVEVLLPSAALILPKVRSFRELPSPAPTNPSRGALPSGAGTPAPLGAPGLPQPTPFATVTRYDRDDPSITAPIPVVGGPQPMAPMAPAAPPQWPMPSTPAPQPVAAGQPPQNRWNDLLSEPYIPAGPGTDGWTLHDETTELPIFREIEAVWFKSRTSVHGADSPSVSPSQPASPAPQPSPAMVASAAPVSAPPRVQTAPVSSPPSSGAPAGSPSTLPSGLPTRPVTAPQPTAPYGASAPAAAQQSTYDQPTVMQQPVQVPPAAAPPSPPPSSESPGNEQWRTRADEGWAAARAAADPQAAGTTRSGLPKRAPQAQLVPGGVVTEQPGRAKRTPDEVRGLLSSYHRGVRRGRAATGADGSKSDGGFPPVSKGNS